jgi:hypothetical protein
MILAQIHTLWESSVLFRVSSVQSADFFYKIMPFFRIFEKKSSPQAVPCSFDRLPKAKKK